MALTTPADTLPANPEEIEIGVGVAGVPTFQVEITNNRYTFFDENISQDLGSLPDLQLVPGKEYVFKLGTVTGHPFNIVTSPGSIGANLYTTGVIGNGSGSNSIVRFTVPQNAPSFLYYQSGIDAANFGLINSIASNTLICKCHSGCPPLHSCKSQE